MNDTYKNHTATNMSSESDPMTIYLNRDFKLLSQKNLEQIVDNDGNTIIHIIAKNLDRDAFDEIKKYNQNAIKYSIINKSNKKMQYPIHLALKSIKKRNQQDHAFIEYMINVLGANPKIPNVNNHIIVSENDDKDDKSLLDLKYKIDNLNKTVINNIKKLTMLIDEKNVDTDQKIPDVNQNDYIINFIKDITNYYKKMRGNLLGGFNGKRKIKNYYGDYENKLSSDNDSFVVSSKNKLLKKHYSNTNEREITGGHKQLFDDRMVDKSMDEYEKIMREEEEYRKEDEKLRNERLIGGDNDELRKKHLDIRDKMKEMERHRMELYGGKKNKHIDKKMDDIKFGSEINSDIFDDSDDDFKMSDMSNNEDYEDVDIIPDGTSSDLGGGRQHREKTEEEKKIDETYRTFIKQIMDNLDVDEETARLYRSALKINIEKTNPELKRRENDALKVKEMENVIKDKKKLQTALKKINIEEIKKHMEQKKEEGERRREEFKKIREEKEKNRSDVASSEGTPKKYKNTESDEKKPKKTKTRQSESGYINSEDIILSSEY